MRKSKFFSIINIIFFSILISCMSILFPMPIFSNTTNESAVLVNLNILNVKSGFTNTYTYKIESDVSNPAGAQDEPKNFLIDVTESDIRDGYVNKTSAIEFSNVKYTKEGIYKYLITEELSRK